MKAKDIVVGEAYAIKRWGDTVERGTVLSVARRTQYTPIEATVVIERVERMIGGAPDIRTVTERKPLSAVLRPWAEQEPIEAAARAQRAAIKARDDAAAARLAQLRPLVAEQIEARGFRYASVASMGKVTLSFESFLMFCGVELPEPPA